jgi:hypothetical protein
MRLNRGIETYLKHQNLNNMKLFLVLLAVAFFVLKLCNVIAWPWVFVVSPLWVLVALYTIGIGFLILWSFVRVRFFSTPEQKAQMKKIIEQERVNAEQERRNAGKSKWQIRMEEMQKAKRVTILILVLFAASCTKHKDNPLPPEPKPSYHLVITCVKYKRDTLFTSAGFIIPRWVCIESRIDTVKN